MANGALKRILGPKRGTKTKLLTKVYYEELRSSYSSADIIRVMKSGRVRSGGHVACVHVICCCGVMKGGEVFDQSNDCYVVRKAVRYGVVLYFINSEQRGTETHYPF